MISSLQQQFTGFLATPQLVFTAGEFSYSNFELRHISEVLPAHFMMPTSIRLGQRMEVFMEAALASENYQLLSKNLQIIAEKQTLGELDFIFRNLATEETIHLEMVYKFYFYRPEIPGSWIDKLIGPNAKDKLRYKLDRLSSHQFPILYKPETKAYLDKIDLNVKILKQQISFKAQLYVPFDIRLKESRIPEDQIQGFYFTINQLEIFSRSEFLFYIPRKDDWVSTPIMNPEVYNYSIFRKKISAALIEQRSCMFWVFETKTKFQKHFATWW